MTSNPSPELSMAQRVALLPETQREEVLAGLDPEALQYDWSFWARPSQWVDPDDNTPLLISLGGRGSGKALDVNTPVPTPTGWTTMGALQAGDEVLDEHGRSCRVLAAHDPYVPQKAYRVTFSDGTWLDACADHQWVTWDHLDRKALNRRRATPRFPENWAARSPILTRDIAETLRYGKRGDLSHCVPLAGTLELSTNENLLIDPYILGYWLGDGSSKSSEIHAHEDDVPHLQAMLKAAGEEFATYKHRTAWRVNVRNEKKWAKRQVPIEVMHEIANAKGKIYAKDLAVMYGVSESFVYTVWEKDSWRNTVNYEDTFTARLRRLGVWGNKHIPQEYLRASEEQRRALLNGLVDSDGYVDPKKSTVEFVSTNETLARGVLELVRTLSGRPVLAKGVATLRGVEIGPKYRVTWRPLEPVALLPRKRANWSEPTSQILRLHHRMITAADPIRPTLMRCITVDSPNAMYLAGEGMIPTHNTRSGVEWARMKAQTMPGSRGIMVARTAADVRDVLINGDSGILNISPPSEMPLWEPSKRLLTWPNGSTCLAYSAEIPDALRGIQSAWSLADEIATWDQNADSSGLTAWDNLRIATRLGTHPQIMAMTTPRRVAMLRQLIADSAANPEKVSVRYSRTSDNRGNLSSAYLDTITALYEGTALAAQELEGQMLDDVEGALWDMDLLEEYRVAALPSDLYRPFVVVGVDPSVAENPRDECGIVVVVGTGEKNYAERHVYVMDDLSLLAPPAEWAEKVAQAARKWGAPVIYEKNQGGALIGNALANVDPTIRTVGVHSRVGKALRADPVQLASQQGRVHMVGIHPGLEDQLTSWQPEITKKSPDRLDAMVLAALSVITDESRHVAMGNLRITNNPAARAARAFLRGGLAEARAVSSSGQTLDSVPAYMQRSARAFWQK